MGALVVVATAVALQGVLISDAAYQIAKERPGFLPFEKMVLKRIPATAEASLQTGSRQVALDSSPADTADNNRQRIRVARRYLGKKGARHHRDGVRCA
jgi:hypothetical protein